MNNDPLSRLLLSDKESAAFNEGLRQGEIAADERLVEAAIIINDFLEFPGSRKHYAARRASQREPVTCIPCRAKDWIMTSPQTGSATGASAVSATASTGKGTG